LQQLSNSDSQGHLIDQLILVAGGIGSRLGTATPKQFLPLAGRPTILRALDAFFSACSTLQVAVVVHPDWLTHWHALWATELAALDAAATPSTFDPAGHTLHVVPGGTTRTASVLAGLQALNASKAEPTDQRVVAIHDAARPLIAPAHITALLSAARTHGSAIPVVPITDSIRELNSDGSQSRSVDRAPIRSVQTPQCFHLPALLAAYAAATTDFTDDASLFEAHGPSSQRLHLAPGDPANFKVTTAADLARADAHFSV